MIIDATTPSLGSVFGLSYEIEPCPEPYRLQKDFSVVVGYASFVEYMRSTYLPDDYMIMEVVRIKQAILAQDLKLQNYYFKYLAVAQLKELFYAQQYNSKQATLYIPELSYPKHIALSEVVANCEKHSDFIIPLMELMTNHDFNVKMIKPGDDLYNAFALAVFYEYKAVFDEPYADFCTIKL